MSSISRFRHPVISGETHKQYMTSKQFKCGLKMCATCDARKSYDRTSKFILKIVQMVFLERTVEDNRFLTAHWSTEDWSLGLLATL